MNRTVSVGLAGPLFLVFLTLKLTAVIDWSWWWVTAPLWAPAVCAVIFIGLAGLLAGLLKLTEKQEARR